MGKLFIISAPSGVGKTSVKKLLLEKYKNIIYSVSYTTREPRIDEIDGIDYNFISKKEFKNMIDNNEFYEYNKVFNNYYGTNKTWINDKLDKGHNILLDLDIFGARKIKEQRLDSVLIFMIAPTFNEIKNRLLLRNTESLEQINLRLNRIKEEINDHYLYDFLLINNDLNKTVDDLINIIKNNVGILMSTTKDFWDNYI